MPILQMVAYPVEDKWQPWANTVAYYPLTSNTTVNDMKGSWTAYNLTNSWVSFGTYNWVDCANFNWSAYLSRTALSEFSSAPFTISLYVYYPALPTTSQVSMIYISQNDTGGWYRWFNLWMLNHSSMPHWQDYRFEVLPWWWLFSWSQAQASWWVHIVWIYNNGIAYLYVNWALSNSWSKSYTYWPNSWFNIGCQVLGDQGNYLLWNISEVIIENKAWTAQEISGYFNLTKSNYWL